MYVCMYVCIYIYCSNYVLLYVRMNARIKSIRARGRQADQQCMVCTQAFSGPSTRQSFGPSVVEGRS